MAEPEDLFEGNDVALAVLARVGALIEAIGPADIRTTRTQVAFRRRRGFAYLWDPGRWLGNPGAPIVLSIATPERIESPRWKEVVHPAPSTWMHHLEVHSPDDLDAEVTAWLTAAHQAAA